MATNPTLLTQPIAANGAKNVIPNTTSTPGAMSQDQGFPAETSLPLGAGGVAPSREDFNGAFNLLSGIAFMAQKGFVFNFDEAQDYYTGCTVRDTLDGLVYRALTDVPASSTHPSADAVNWELAEAGASYLVGEIKAYAGNGTLPDGFLLCDGSAISRTLYADLFTAIGTTYGVGDGSTTFNLPDLSDNRFLEGSTTAGTAKAAGLPNIKGTFATTAGIVSAFLFSGSGSNVNGATNGACTTTKVDYAPIFGSSASTTRLVPSIDASQLSSIYSDSVTTVQPKSLTVRFIIYYGG